MTVELADYTADPDTATSNGRADTTAVMNILMADLDTYRFVPQVEVTPSLARRLIDLNIENNRHLKPRTRDRYARDMTNGKWRERTGQTVKIATNGRVVDGLHRLHAVVLSGVTLKFDLTFGIAPEDMPAIDAGAARSTGDVIRVSGGGDIGRAGPIVKHVIAWELGSPMGPNGSTTATPIEVQERYQADALLFEAAAARGGDCQRRNVGTGAALGTAYFMLAKQFPEGKSVLDDFYDQLVSGIYPVKVPEFHAPYRLRERLIARRSERLSRAEMIALTVRAWNRHNTLDAEGNREKVHRLQSTRSLTGETLNNTNFPKLVRAVLK